MKCESCTQWSLFGLRFVVAIIFLTAGLQKAFDWQMAMDAFVSMGFPGFLGPLVGFAEVLAAVFVLLGFWHTGANYVLAGIIMVALLFVQIPAALQTGTFSIGLQRDLLIFASTLVLAWAGSGKFSVE